MKLDETWLRAHLPPEDREAPLDCFSGEYLDGLTVMAEGERGGQDSVVYEAKDEEDLRWWQLEQICRFLPAKEQKKKTWRWYRQHAENNQWRYVELRHYDYNAIEDTRLYGFESFLRNLKYGFPPERWEEKVREYVRLMNCWYSVPHWDYDREALCFIKISDSKEHDTPGGPDEPQPGSVLRIIDGAEQEARPVAAHSEQDDQYAAEFREGVHREALEKLRRIDPDIKEVVDRYPVESYFEDNWEYPGKWYTYVAVPPDSGGRQRLIETIVQDTLSQRRSTRARQTGEKAETSRADAPETKRASAPKARQAQPSGKQLDVKHYDYEKLFTVSLDQQSRSVRLVGRDSQGRFILEDYGEYSLGSATGSYSEYYVLTYEEYRRYAKQALVNCNLSREEYNRVCSLADGPEGTVVYRDARYTLGRKNDRPYVRAGAATFLLSCHPYEPCLYITDKDGDKTAVHNAFDPSDLLRNFSKGKTVTSITGREYSARDFCEMVEYAAGRRNISISDAEQVFGDRPERKTPAAPKEKAPEAPPARSADGGCPDDPFYTLIADYPDCAVDYYIAAAAPGSIQGGEAHRKALAEACLALFTPDEDMETWRWEIGRAVGRRIDAKELFTSNYPKHGLNYRKAFLYPPHGNSYTGKDFVKVNAALFPNGTDGLEVYEWTTDWSDYFDEGHEWWGALCLTVYDKSADRFAVIMASATD